MVPFEDSQADTTVDLVHGPVYYYMSQNLVFDSETNSVLRAEMAKKNLYVKRGIEYPTTILDVLPIMIVVEIYSFLTNHAYLLEAIKRSQSLLKQG